MIKGYTRRYFTSVNNNNLVLGGPGVEVEVDETVFCRRGIIRDPTFCDDDVRDTVWILGTFEKNNKSKLFCHACSGQKDKQFK